MSDKIYGPLSDDFKRRMRNWVKARDGAPVSMGVSVYELGVGVDRYRQVSEPMLYGEAKDTEIALNRLPVRYADAVKQFWLFEGNSLRWHARRTGKHHLDYHTFEAWVIKGHALLKAELDELGKIYRAHREAARAAGAGA